MITFLSFLATIGGICGIYNVIKEHRNKKKEEEEISTPSVSPQEVVPASSVPATAGSQQSTGEMIQETFQALGCQIHDGQGTDIIVDCQGESFVMEHNDSAYVRIWDYFWASFKKDEVDHEKIKTAINFVNQSFGPTLLWSVNPETGEMLIHSRMDIVLIPNINGEERKAYLMGIIKSFFDIKNRFAQQINQIKAEMESSSVCRQPIWTSVNYN